jgi:hypothetical protein
MIVELFALEMVKNLNLSVDFALRESLNGTFKTNGREEKNNKEINAKIAKGRTPRPQRKK